MISGTVPVIKRRAQKGQALLRPFTKAFAEK
jgi:hypothetical protein